MTDVRSLQLLRFCLSLAGIIVATLAARDAYLASRRAPTGIWHVMALTGLRIDCFRIVTEFILGFIAFMALLSPPAAVTTLSLVSNIGQAIVTVIIPVGSVMNITERRYLFEQGLEAHEGVNSHGV